MANQITNPLEAKKAQLNAFKKYILLEEKICRIIIPEFPEEKTYFSAIKTNSPYTIYDKNNNKINEADTLKEAQVILEREALIYLNRNYRIKNGEIEKTKI